MPGIVLEVSDATIAVLSGSGGVLATVATQWAVGRFGKAREKKEEKPQSLEDCRRSQEENKKQHEEFFQRIGKLEGDRREDRAILEATRDGVARIEGKIDKLMM